MENFIYALCDPITFEVRYVGKSNNPYNRFYDHLKDKGKYHKALWVQSLLKIGKLPILQIIDQCDISEWQEKEKDWIAFYKKIGSNLTNSTDGGENPPKRKGKKLTDIQRKKISNGLKNAYVSGKRKPAILSSETLKKMGAAHKGKPSGNKGKHPSDECRKQMSKSHKGKIPPNKGIFGVYHASEETKKKISDGCPWKGKSLPHETRKKISIANKGKKRTEEMRKRNSEAHKGHIPWNKGLKIGHYRIKV